MRHASADRAVALRQAVGLVGVQRATTQSGGSAPRSCYAKTAVVENRYKAPLGTGPLLPRPWRNGIMLGNFLHDVLRLTGSLLQYYTGVSLGASRSRGSSLACYCYGIVPT